MPQQELFGMDPTRAGVRLTVEEVLHEGRDLRWRVTLQSKPRPDSSWCAWAITVMEGIEMDYLPTLTNEVLAAWAYGSSKDVMRVWQRTIHEARLHRRAHRYMS